MMVLALDLATRLGFAHGLIGERPVWGAHDLGRGRSNGQVLDDYLAWLHDTLDKTRATIVAFESPYMPTGPNNPFAAPANALTIRRLFAFAGFTEAVCHCRKLRCYEARPSEITRAFLGGPAPRKRADKKAATVRMARLLGYPVVDDDEADALALWMYAESIFSPQMISQRRAAGGLELDLHATQTKSAPRRQPRSARTIADGKSGNGITNAEYTSTGRQLQFTAG